MEANRKVAYFAILLFGLISLFGDIIYEGARGIISPYLEFLGATAFIVGIVAGIGDFVGYALRLLSGYLADVKRTYWIFVFIGYGLLIAVPLLAFASFSPALIPAWLIASILVIMERLGKAIRTPARDTLLSVTTKGVGAGKAFGFHELMDQLGAIIGPAIMTVVLYVTMNNYFIAFSAMFIPYAILMFVLFAGYTKLKPITSAALRETKIGSKTRAQPLPSKFLIYTTAVFFNTAGLLHALLILYIASHFLNMPAWEASILFLIIQGVDALIAPLIGIAYDRAGVKVLMVPFALSVFPAIFAFSLTRTAIYVAAVFFGLILGMQESVYRAAVADMTPVEVRGSAYGIFSTVYGVGFLVSGTVFGLLIDYASYPLAIMYAVIAQIIGIMLLIIATRTR